MRKAAAYAQEFQKMKPNTKSNILLDFRRDRGRNETLVCLAPPSEPDLQISRIRLSS